MVSPANIHAAFTKPFMPVVFFFAGVTYDTVTLTRIDRLQDNLILLLYLTLLGFLIVLVGRVGTGGVPVAEPAELPPGIVSLVLRARPYSPMAIQFLLGGLFSAYTVFYSRSASFTTTAVFFGLLVAFLVANEFLKSRLTNIRLLVSLYALVCFAFFTFFLPVVTGRMNTLVFLTGAVLSGLVTLRVVDLIYRENAAFSRKDLAMTTAPPLAVIGALVGFYFLNWIPPVPLSLQFGGIYHKIAKENDTYTLSFAKGAWYQVWKRSDNRFPAEQQVFCFTAVFAPVDLNTTIYHNWQYRPHSKKPFRSADRLPIKISGGREGGYRAYTVKQGLDAGEWRVDVQTEDGRVLGRVSFRVEERSEAPALKTIAY